MKKLTILLFVACATLAAAQFNPASNLPFITQARSCLYNAKGLERWFTGLAQVGYKADGVTGAGGVDILCLGDSYAQGSGNNDYQGFGLPDHGAIQGWPNEMRKILQPVLNPASVPGGYGWFQLTRDGGVGATIGAPDGCYASSADIHLNRPFNGWNGSSGTGGGIGRQLHEFTSGAERWVRYNFNPSVFPITDIQLVGVQGGAFYLDVSPDPGNSNKLTKGSGSYAADHSAMAGDFWGAVTTPVAINGGVVPSGNFTVQIDNNSADYYCSGMMLYNKDKDKGVRVWNCGLGSATTAMWANETVTQESHAQIGRSSADGTSIVQGSNCRLVIIMLGANDWTGRTKAQYKTDITTLITWSQTLTSKPSVLLVEQTPRYDGSADAWLSIMQFRDALKEICDDSTMGAYTSLYDSWKFYNYLSPQQITSQFNAIRSDHVHPTEASVGPGAANIGQGIAVNLIPRTSDIKLAMVLSGKSWLLLP